MEVVRCLLLPPAHPDHRQAHLLFSRHPVSSGLPAQAQHWQELHMKPYNLPLVNCSYSIVIPAYNREAFLPQCLDSVLAQTHLDWECIVVDDGSSDQSRAIVESYQQGCSQIRLVCQSNQGAAAARNQGILASRGRRVIFLDSDDYLLPTALEHFDLGFQTGCKLVCGFWNKPSPGSCQPGGSPPIRVVDGFMGNLFVGERPPLSMSTVAIERSCLEKIGPMKAMPCEDWEFWIRATACYPVAFIQAQVSCYRRSHGDGINDRLKADGRITTALARVLAEIKKDPLIQERLQQDPHLRDQFERLHAARLLMLEAASQAFNGLHQTSAETLVSAVRLCRTPEETRALLQGLQQLLFYPTHLPLQAAQRALRTTVQLSTHLQKDEKEIGVLLTNGCHDSLFWQARDLLYQGERLSSLQLAVAILAWSRSWRSCRSFVRYLWELLWQTR